MTINIQQYYITQSDWFYTFLYLLISLCMVNPPVEFISAGVTIQSIFSYFLGSEQLHFIQYHIRRTSTTVFVHSCIPLGYYIGHGIFLPHSNMFNLSEVTTLWKVYLLLSLTLAMSCGLLVRYWYAGGTWRKHPIVRTLHKFSTTGQNWKDVAAVINVEFRRVDKFTSGLLGRRIIVTDSWIVRLSTYYIHMGKQQNVVVTLTKADDHPIGNDGSITGSQYLTIHVDHVDSTIKSFDLRINANELADLQQKLQVPVRNLRGLTLKQSLADRFVSVFAAEIQHNPQYVVNNADVLEPCIGCMQRTSNIKLQKLCADPQDGECRQCNCRPMWCMECMARWYASRQNQAEPEGWMSNRSPCPTCRSIFCMRDVCTVVVQN